MTPVVLLPGMMCDPRLWGPVMGAFAGRDTLHPACTAADSVEALAAAVLTFAPPRFALAGLSMGGIVAMEVLRQAPERVERVALLDTNPLAETEPVRALRAPQIERAMAGRLEAVMRDEMKPNYLAQSNDNTAILDLCMNMALSLGPAVFARQSTALATRADQQDTLRRYTRPALVLMGVEDRLCPRKRHDLMHALMPHSALVIVEGAGHLPTLERPADTARALSDWLTA